jgi:hypothetical protein
MAETSVTLDVRGDIRSGRSPLASVLEADGYVAAQDPADAASKPVPKTVVYFRGGSNAGQNRSDAKYVADTYFSGAHVALLDADLAANIADSAQVVIIVGVDYAGASTGGG